MNDEKVDEQMRAAEALLDEAESGLGSAMGDAARDFRIKIAGARISLAVAHTTVDMLRTQREALRRTEPDW